ncbi:unnamed protein product [Periconia digitata]|uniref:Zn(2)-C6 fungal-type domain-containing protein n=1 Tax=Periconia digitata TaxID=1303443 RepID=A0A9W4U899_9PLEO|nr:unnamed protein product [Periconia digitata]
MPSRITHSKSRHSCERCKQRRVKCDIKTPCGHCQRRGERCSLVSDTRVPESSPIVGGARPIPSRHPSIARDHTQTHTHLEPLDDFSFLSLFVLSEQPSPRPLTWTEDLFLISHFTSSTSYTLSHRDADRHLWRVMVPELAVAHPFLMHGLLAVSAMHLSYLRPLDRIKHETQSSHHQTLATSQFREVLSNISADNCNAVFVMCALLTLISMVSIARRSDAHVSNSFFVDDIVHHFMLTRGIGAVLGQHWQIVLTGPLKMLSTERLTHPEEHRLPESIEARFHQLRSSILPDICRYDEASLLTCISSLASLETVYKHMHFLHPDLPRPKLEVGVALRWMSLVPLEFMTLLKSSHPGALVLLAHFIILFETFEDVWFLQGWSEHALGRIKDAVGAEASTALQWPCERLSLEKERKRYQ